MEFRRPSWLLLMSLALVAQGCSKGDTGPTGPPGPTGSANVIYSRWYDPGTAPDAAWALVPLFGIQERTFTMTSTSITQAVIDNGVALVYIKFAGLGGAIEKLPVSVPDIDESFNYRPMAGSILALYWKTSAPGTDPGVLPTGNMVRFILIPGVVPAASVQLAGDYRASLISELKSMTYQEICRKYNIPE